MKRRHVSTRPILGKFQHERSHSDPFSASSCDLSVNGCYSGAPWGAPASLQDCLRTTHQIISVESSGSLIATETHLVTSAFVSLCVASSYIVLRCCVSNWFELSCSVVLCFASCCLMSCCVVLLCSGHVFCFAMRNAFASFYPNRFCCGFLAGALSGLV